VDALIEGRAFAALPGHRIVRVRGADAKAWLHDLVTCDVASLEPGDARRSMLLSPTGHIRADFTVARDQEGWLLLQAPDQPDPIAALLAPYVLSSDVSIVDLSPERMLFAIPGADPPGSEGATVLRPSVLGPGVDLLVARGEAGGVRRSLIEGGVAEASPADVDAWRIVLGDPRMGPDFGSDALPAEVGLEFAIDLTKGCFLGQESVARVRNLGHPTSVLRHVRTAAALAAGAPVLRDGEDAGIVTSGAPTDRGTVAILRVRWAFASTALTSETGEAIVDVGSSG